MISYIKGRTRLRIFENRILRLIFEPEMDANGELRRLQNEELHILYRSLNIVRMIKSRRSKWGGHVARMEEGRSAFIILTGTPSGKRLLGRPGHRWENNIRIDHNQSSAFDLITRPAVGVMHSGQ